MKGTIIANNAAIKMEHGDTLEGRALSTAGAITVDEFWHTLPIGLRSTHLTDQLLLHLDPRNVMQYFLQAGRLQTPRNERYR